jgi:hypothetical protein
MRCCCCCNDVIFEDTMLMSDFLLQRYNEFVSSQQDEPVNIVDNSYYRFVWGDIVPKQGWQTFSKYIEPHVIQEYNEQRQLYKDMQ